MYPLADRVLSTALSTYIRARCGNTLTLFALALLEHTNKIQVNISMGNLADGQDGNLSFRAARPMVTSGRLSIADRTIRSTLSTFAMCGPSNLVVHTPLPAVVLVQGADSALRRTPQADPTNSQADIIDPSSCSCSQ